MAKHKFLKTCLFLLAFFAIHTLCGSEEKVYPQWDRQTTAEEYAKTNGLELEIEIEINGDEKLKLALVPPTTFKMGLEQTSEPSITFFYITAVLVLIELLLTTYLVISKLFWRKKDDGEEPSFLRNPKKVFMLQLGVLFILCISAWLAMGEAESLRNHLEVLKRTQGAKENEFPAQLVKITKPFYMSKYEITRQQFAALMKEDPSLFKALPLDAPFPVDNVTWQEAVTFSQKLSQHTNKKFRLPTEAEWHLACSLGKKMRFSLGDEIQALQASAWYNNEVNSHPEPVGRKQANHLGLYDMHGNVWEWCSDWFDLYPQTKEMLVDPQGPKDGNRKVLRGGSWKSPAERCTNNARFYKPKDFKAEKPSESMIGFRVIMEID